MNGEMQLVWQEIIADFMTAAFVWQASVIVISLMLAWSINGLLRAYVMKHAPADWKVGIGGINRVLFPLSSLIFVFIGQFVIHHWQHTSMLKLATTLLLAMAAIRLLVYAIRYTFVPSGWVQKTESAIATSIWVVLALHLSGFLPELVSALDDISFSVGKNKITLLIAIQAIITMLLTIVTALWVSRLIENRIMRSDHINMNMRVVLGKVVRIFLTLIAILIAFSAIGLDITLLSVFGGALGVGLGFGLQKIASNFVSGFIILLDDSMHLGDLVTIDNHFGVVSDLRARYLVLRKLDGTEVVIPNENLITNPVINHSLSDHKCMVKMPIQVSYESPLELAMQLVKESAIKQARVLTEPAPDVLLKGFGESGIDLSLNFWIPDPEEGSGGLQSKILLDIWNSFQKNGISIPYPQREIRIIGNSNNQTKPI